MRIWIFESPPAWESPTRHGLYASPSVAWDDLFDLVQKNVWENHVDFSVYVGADPEAPDPQDNTRPIVLLIRYQGGDEIRLGGESVKGDQHYGHAPSLADWRDLQQVGALLRMHAVQVLGYRSTDPKPDGILTGRWRFSRED